jgi:hypothetical protein
MKRPFDVSSLLRFLIVVASFICLTQPAMASGTVYFYSGFETGDVSEWIGDGGGNHTGGGYVTTEKPRTGDYSWKAFNDPRLAPPDDISAKLLRWRLDYKQAFYSAWYFWPEDFVVSGVGSQYVNIFQWKERTSPYDPTWIVAVKNSYEYPGHDELVVHDWHNAKIYRNGVKLPKGQWFQLKAFMKTGRTDGKLTVWLNGIQIFDFTNINTLGNSPNYLMWGVGSYGGCAYGKHLYVDDVRVSTESSFIRPPVNLRVVSP